MRYKILSEGQGEIPSEGSALIVTYTGKLINGMSFVSSSDEGKPVFGPKGISFTYIQGNDLIISGIKDALKDMKEGEKRLLVIPPDKAFGYKNGFYGKEIKGQKRLVISPGETLIIEVTLNKIKD
jgi:FKBP-type peptidyl-prolyl cis-trans isomerase